MCVCRAVHLCCFHYDLWLLCIQSSVYTAFTGGYTESIETRGGIVSEVSVVPLTLSPKRSIPKKKKSTDSNRLAEEHKPLLHKISPLVARSPQQQEYAVMCVYVSVSFPVNPQYVFFPSQINTEAALMLFLVYLIHIRNQGHPAFLTAEGMPRHILQSRVPKSLSLIENRSSDYALRILFYSFLSVVLFFEIISSIRPATEDKCLTLA